MRISDWSSDVCSSDLGTTAYLEDEAFIEKSKDAARKSLRGLFERADAQLANNDWIAGGRSIADPYLYVVTRWAKGQGVDLSGLDHLRSEERRVGKEWVSTGRSWWSPDHSKKKKTKKQ